MSRHRANHLCSHECADSIPPAIDVPDQARHALRRERSNLHRSALQTSAEGIEEILDYPRPEARHAVMGSAVLRVVVLAPARRFAAAVEVSTARVHLYTAAVAAFDGDLGEALLTTVAG